MFTYVLLCAGLLLAVCNHVTGYGTGAPLTRCGDMRPSHGYESGTESPYSVEVDASYYTKSSTITVHIKGYPEDVYKGFLLQARAQGGKDPIGWWSIDTDDSHAKTIDCNDQYASAVTHSNTNDKSALTTYTWHSPGYDAGDIVFIATVAQKKTMWWMNLKNEVVYKDTDDKPEPQPEPTTHTPHPYPRPSAATMPSCLGCMVLLISSLLTVYIVY